MTVIIRRPGRALSLFEPMYRPFSIFNDIDELSRHFWDSWRPAVFRTSLVLHTDMYTENGELVVKTELTGVKKEDLDISLEGDVLTIKAEKKDEEVAEEATHYASERHFGQYSRSLSLPYHVDADKASATFENGLLEIRIPRAEEARAKQIEIKAQIAEGGEKKRSKKGK